MGGGVLDRICTSGRHNHRRQGLLHRPWADRYSAELVVAPFPGKGLWLSQRLQQQVHALKEPGAAFGRVHTVRQVLAGDATQECHDHPATSEIVQHPNLLGSPDGIVMLQQLP
jgi:hypothetical protein